MEDINQEKLKQERELKRAERYREKQEAYAWRKKEKKRMLAEQKEKCLSLGLTHYTWSAVDDGRCCEGCLQNKGKVFSWNEPPEKTGHPGEGKCCTDPCGCRCCAISCFDFDEKIVTDNKEINNIKIEKTFIEYDSRFLKDQYSYWNIVPIVFLAILVWSVSIGFGVFILLLAVGYFFKKQNSFKKVEVVNGKIIFTKKNNRVCTINMNQIYSIKQLSSFRTMVKIDNATLKKNIVRFKKPKDAMDFVSKMTGIIQDNGGFAKKPYNYKRDVFLIGAMMGAFYAIFRR